MATGVGRGAKGKNVIYINKSPGEGSFLFREKLLVLVEGCWLRVAGCWLRVKFANQILRTL
jgi:hypothetical protein